MTGMGTSARGCAIVAAAMACALGCPIPSTLGLACSDDTHCDGGQVCSVSGVCEVPSDAEPTSSSSVTTDDVSTSTTVEPVTSSSGEEDPATTSSSSTSSTTTTSTTTSAESSSTTIAGCSSPEGCESVDVLFVIDNSESMTEDFAVLLPAFTDLDALIGPIVEQYCGYHVGVTTTEVAPDYQPVECQVRGALNQSGALAAGDPCFEGDHPPFLTEDDPLAAIGCLLAVGQNYDDDEKQVDTMLAALDPSLAVEGGCNEGFRRPGTPLIIVMVTDEDDDDDSRTAMESVNRTGSDGNPGQWFESLMELEDPNNVGLILIAADQVGGCDWVPDPSDDGSGAEYPARLLTFAQYFTGSGLVSHVEVINMCAEPLEIVAQLAGLSTVIEAVCADATGG